jgi:hypothetical protein
VLDTRSGDDTRARKTAAVANKNRLEAFPQSPTLAGVARMQARAHSIARIYRLQ